jgi:hypothetical protein
LADSIGFDKNIEEEDEGDEEGVPGQSHYTCISINTICGAIWLFIRGRFGGRF